MSGGAFGQKTFGDPFGGDGGELSITPSYSEFFLGSKKTVVDLETLEIQHPAFSQTYRLVRNATAGITVERLAQNEAAGSYAFAYCPMRVTAIDDRDNLDAGYRIELGDVGEILPTELDRVAAQNAYGIEPVVLYRCYRSDNLAAPMYGPVRLEVDDFSFTREGASFEARAPGLNDSTTGDTYGVARFPSLRGFTV